MYPPVEKPRPVLPDYLKIVGVPVEENGVKTVTNQIWAKSGIKLGDTEMWFHVTPEDGVIRTDAGGSVGWALSFDDLNIARQIIGLSSISRQDFDRIRQDMQPSR